MGSTNYERYEIGLLTMNHYFTATFPKAHGLIVKLAGFISSDSANWIKHHSQFETAWENIPELNPDAKRILDQARNRDNNFDVLN